MLKNLLKVAIRSTSQNLSYSALNILGLTLGITCSLFLALYIFDELSFDKFHHNKDRIFRVISTFNESGKETNYNITQIPLVTELAGKHSEVEGVVRIMEAGRELFINAEHDKRFYEEKFYYADSSIFDVFDFELTSGNPKTALSEPNTAVITKATSERYFGSENPVGKTLENKGKLFKITGVLRNTPANSHLQFDALLSFMSVPKTFSDWAGWYTHTYLLLREGAAPAAVEKILAGITRERVTPVFKDFGIKVNYWMQPLTDIHLKSNFGDEAGENGDISYIYIFSAIAVFLLVIANINYVNLATARAARRAKEIGIRKTMGSTKGQIILQFITESTLLTFIALVLSFVVIAVLLPYFNNLSGKKIDLVFLLSPQFLTGCLLLVLVAGVAGGSYPAFYISHFNPVLVLKGNVTRGLGGARLRQVLVVLQFAISITMLICTSVVYDQLQFLRQKDLGFSGEQVVNVTMPDSVIQRQASTLYHRLKGYSNILEVSTSSTTPGKDLFYSIMKIETPTGVASRGVNYCMASYDYVQTLGIPVVKGRNFSRRFATDTSAVLINEAMVKSIKWNDPIGKRFTFDDGMPNTVDRSYTVVGVIKDFHQQSLHSPIQPLAVFFQEQNYYLNVKVRATDVEGTVAFMQHAWQEVNRGKPFSYTFLDQDFYSQYLADVKRGQIFSLFSVVCVVISCLGLFGLAAYTTEQRAKEIGIRKAIGASVPSIVALFYKNFLALIGIGLLIAFPFSYFFMRNWLLTFAYQTDIRWVSFLSATLITLIITMGSISFHTIRSAMTNPVKTLRSE